MDSFEEFEFKPLTEGLGFHNKTNTKKNDETSAPKKAELKSNLFKGKISDEKIEIKSELLPPLPRKENKIELKKEIPLKPEDQTVDEILKTLNSKKKIQENLNNKISTEKPVFKYVSTGWDLSASLLDGMLIFALSLLCMIVLLLVTQVDLFANLAEPDQEYYLYFGLLGLFSAMAWIYLVSTRVFLGYTPGEWVFDQRLGLPEQMNDWTYGAKVALRSLIMLATGYFILPLISMILNKDFVGKLMNLELVRKIQIQN